jgi:heavy metal translocating P-type ATPase
MAQRNARNRAWGAETIVPPLGRIRARVSLVSRPEERRWSKETWIAMLAMAGIVAHLAARFTLHGGERVYNVPLIFILVAGSAPLLFDLFKRAFAREFGSDLLAGISIVTAFIMREYLAGSIVLLMLSGGAALENYATRRASRVLGALAKRMPSVAHKLADSKIVDVALSELRVSDRVVVFPHEICPADGIVVEGRGEMDESYLTGEPFRIGKVPGAAVLSGAVNGGTALTVLVGKLPVDSRYAKIMRVMQEAETNRPRMRRVADRLGAWYTVAGLAVAASAWVAAHDQVRFLAVLVIATPCPLLLAVPVAIIGAISVAASRAIVIKNPAMLERIGSCRTVIFDKTGTLTYGKPALTEVVCAPNFSRAQALQLAASLEQFSKHPLAGSILEAAREEGLKLLPVSEVREKPGEGLSGSVGAQQVRITGRKALAMHASELPPAAGGMECLLSVDGNYKATFRFHDVPRKESRLFVGHLAPRHRVEKVMLVSGDRDEEVRYLAAEVGIAEVLSGKSPEEKLAIVRAESRKGPVLFVGDGINDAPAMQAATVGVAFGQGGDITAEAADAVVLEASLGKVDELIHIGNRMRAIALQSAMGGMALSVIGMMVATAGHLPPVAGAITQEVIDVISVLNALRATLPGRQLRDAGL